MSIVDEATRLCRRSTPSAALLKARAEACDGLGSTTLVMPDQIIDTAAAVNATGSALNKTDVEQEADVEARLDRMHKEFMAKLRQRISEQRAST